MNIKASGRSALILATGLFVCFAGPSQAAATALTDAATEIGKCGARALNKYAKHSPHHGKTYAHRKSGKAAALKSSTDKKTTDVADDDRATAMPPSVANANAQLASADTPAGNAKAMTARANNILQATPDNSAGAQPATDTPVVSADQLNDVDRALHESNPPAAAVAMASAEPPHRARQRRPAAAAKAQPGTRPR